MNPLLSRDQQITLLLDPETTRLTDTTFEHNGQIYTMTTEEQTAITTDITDRLTAMTLPPA